MKYTTSLGEQQVMQMALQRRAGILPNDVWSQCTPALRKKGNRTIKKISKNIH